MKISVRKLIRRKREQVSQEQKKKTSRLSFDDEGSVMAKGAGMGVTKKAVSGAGMVVSGYAHGKVHDVEQDNTAVEAVHKSELVAEGSGGGRSL